MSYGLLITLHLLAAVAFAGTVFFEVVLLANVHSRVPQQHMLPVEQALGTQRDRRHALGVASAVFCGSRLGLAAPLGTGAPIGQQYRHADGAQDCAGA